MPVVGGEPSDNLGEVERDGIGRYQALDEIAAPLVDIGAIVNRHVEEEKTKYQPSQHFAFWAAISPCHQKDGQERTPGETGQHGGKPCAHGALTGHIKYLLQFDDRDRFGDVKKEIKGDQDQFNPDTETNDPENGSVRLDPDGMSGWVKAIPVFHFELRSPKLVCRRLGLISGFYHKAEVLPSVKMKKEDPVHALHGGGRMSMRKAGRIMDAIFQERDRLFRNRHLVVKTSPLHGRGVFATQHIPAHAILEECHLIPLEERSFEKIDPGLKDYVFLFPRGSKGDERAYAISLGIGSIINHSQEHPNATWTTSESRRLFIFTAIRDIRAGEEILIDYQRELFP